MVLQFIFFTVDVVENGFGRLEVEDGYLLVTVRGDTNGSS